MRETLWKELAVSPEEEEMVRSLREGGVGKHLPPEKMNEFHVGREEQIRIDTRVGPTLVHGYWPERGDGPVPLFMNMHGGGFVKGRRDQDIVFCRNICSRSGVAIADVDYVPAPAMRYPGQVYACYDVMLYLAEHARELGADPRRIAVGGHSAGGNLAAAIILMSIDRGTFVPALQILDYAGFDLVTPAARKRNGTTNERVPPWKADFYNKMYVDPEDAGEAYCSPGLATDAQLSRMPPTLILYCDNDTFCDEDAAFHRRLADLGVPVCGKRFFHSSHGFLVQRAGEYQLGEKMLLAALNTLKQE